MWSRWMHNKITYYSAFLHNVDILNSLALEGDLFLQNMIADDIGAHEEEPLAFDKLVLNEGLVEVSFFRLKLY